MSEEIIKIPEKNQVSFQTEMLEQFKSLSYLLKGKRDTQIRLYDENRTFYKHDIVDLNDRIQEKLLLHNVNNLTVNISVGLSQNKIKSFGNWDEFLKEKWDTNDETESIVLNWDFEVILPNRIHTLPQTHSLKVRIGREIKPSEFLHLMMIGSDEFELEESTSQMVCKIDFINSVLANELLDRVNEWYNSLTIRKQENEINKILHKWNTKIIMIAEVFIIISGLCLFYPFAEFLLVKSNKILDTSEYLKLNFYLVAGVFISFTIFTRIAVYYSRKIDRTINSLQGTPIFEITRGDKNLLDKIILKNKSLRKEIFMKIFISIICSGILYLTGKSIMYLIENIN